MSRGMRLLKLASNSEMCKFNLNLPSHETTKGTTKFEQRKAIQNFIFQQSDRELDTVIEKCNTQKFTHKLPEEKQETSCTSSLTLFIKDSTNSSMESEPCTEIEMTNFEICKAQKITNKTSGQNKKPSNCPVTTFSKDDTSDIDYCESESEYIPSNESESDSESNLSIEKDGIEDLNNTLNTDDALQSFKISKVPNSTIIGTHTKKYFCIFCKKLVTRFARHLITLHKKENKVKDILAYPIKHKERQNRISFLRNEGTFMYNTNKLHNKGHLIVTRRPNISKKRRVKDYSPCPSCSAYFVSNNLNRHIKHCIMNEKTNSSRGIKSQARALQIEMDLKYLNLHPHVSALLSGLKNDEISETIKNDLVLLRLASHLCKKYRTEKHLKHYTRQKLRQLARLLIMIKENNPEISGFSDCLQPTYFHNIISAVQKVCKLNEETGEFEIPSLANHLGMHLKECVNVLYSMCIVEQNDSKKKLVADFKELMSLEFGATVSRAARKTLDEAKWNKPKLLPVISDIKTFRDHLLNVAESAKNYLETYSFSYIEWRKLVEITAALLLLFNRKRPGETERIFLTNYNQKQSIDQDSEDYSSLSTLEKLLCKSFKRIEIRGKLGRRVPILLRQQHIQYIDIFLKYRDEAGVSKNPYLFAIDHKNFVKITDILRRESTCSGAQNPELLRATYLRKQVATTSQVLDLNDNEMQMLADFMGHDIAIHKAHYRTPEITLQIARLSKLLIAVDEGDLEKYKDKNLCNIDIADYLNVDKETEVPILSEINEPEMEEDEINSIEPAECDTTYLLEQENTAAQNIQKETSFNTSPTKEAPSNMSGSSAIRRSPKKKTGSTKFVTPPKQKHKIKRTTWITPEKRVARTLFKHHLDNKTLPTEKEVAKAIRKHPELQRRSALQLKAWINNQNKRAVD